ncbi:MAG: hypothetical protein K5985_02990 [Lachnospiraceae bacterium]|nr:hypothetical protein [Lachnospiraceae bacterium]
MKKNLLKATALVMAMGMCFTGVPQVAMAAESSVNYQKVAEFGPEDGINVTNYLTMEEIAAWADMYGYEYEAREFDGGTKLYVARVDEANSGQTAGSGDVGEAVLEGGSGYITGAMESIGDDLENGNAADAFVEGAAESGAKGLGSGFLEGVDKSLSKSAEEGRGLASTIVHAIGGGLFGAATKAGKEAVKGGVVNAGAKMAQNANEKGVENAKEGYASVMDTDEEPAYIVYVYVFENGNPYCVCMEQILPTGNRENFIDAFYATFDVSEEYDLRGYRDYNVFISGDGSGFIVGPINEGNVYETYYIPGDNPDKYGMVEYIINNFM